MLTLCVRNLQALRRESREARPPSCGPAHQRLCYPLLLSIPDT